MNQKNFENRLVTFYSSWKNNNKDLWGNSDILVLCTPSSGTSPNPISSSFYVWLLGHDIPNTIAIFTKDEIYFICTEEWFSILQSLEETAELAVCARVKVILKNERETGLKIMDNIIQWIRNTEKAWAIDVDEISPHVVGYIYNESPKSDLLLCCAINLTKNEFLSVRIAGFSQLLTQHEYKPFAEDIQMLNRAQEVEQVLLVNEEEKTTEAHDKTQSPYKGAADLSTTAVMYDVVEIASYAECLAGISRIQSDEEDEWVLVESSDDM